LSKAEIEQEIQSLLNEIDFSESELQSGYLDPGETFELKKQIKRMQKKVSEYQKLL